MRAGFALMLVLGCLRAQEQPATQRPVPLPKDPSATERPKVQRGRPTPKPPQPDTPEPNPAPTLPPYREVVADDSGKVESDVISSDSKLDLIERARAAADATIEGLPNFLCNQLTYRQVSHTMKPSWIFKDRVEAELVWVNGAEDYRNLRINGKPVKKGSPMDTGTWSTGEFGSILGDIFSPATRARFALARNSEAAGVKAKVFDFSVQQPNSHWKVILGRTIYPAYSGAVWIDPATATVLRIEKKGREIPATFGLDHFESAVDYDWVRIGSQKYLLPVKSENIACFRGTSDCTLNQIEFRNYRKFSAESQILQVESDITFPDAEEVKKPTPKKQ